MVKVKRIKQETTFRPVEVTIVIETRKQLLNLLARMRVSKDKVDSSYHLHKDLSDSIYELDNELQKLKDV